MYGWPAFTNFVPNAWKFKKEQFCRLVTTDLVRCQGLRDFRAVRYDFWGEYSVLPPPLSYISPRVRWRHTLKTLRQWWCRPFSRYTSKPWQPARIGHVKPYMPNSYNAAIYGIFVRVTYLFYNHSHIWWGKFTPVDLHWKPSEREREREGRETLMKSWE